MFYVSSVGSISPLNLNNILFKFLTEFIKHFDLIYHWHAILFLGYDELPQASAGSPGVQAHPRPSGELPQLPGVNLRSLLPVPWWRPLAQIHVNRVQRT